MLGGIYLSTVWAGLGVWDGYEALWGGLRVSLSGSGSRKVGRVLQPGSRVHLAQTKTLSTPYADLRVLWGASGFRGRHRRLNLSENFVPSYTSVGSHNILGLPCAMWFVRRPCAVIGV